MMDESAIRSLLDEEALRMFVIDAVGGDRAIVQELVQSYLESAGTLAENLSMALAREDWALLQRSAHSLKSSSKMFGLHAVAQKCATVEEGAGATPRDELTTLVGQIVTEIKGIQEILPGYCDQVLEATKSGVS